MNTKYVKKSQKCIQGDNVRSKGEFYIPEKPEQKFVEVNLKPESGFLFS